MDERYPIPSRVCILGLDFAVEVVDEVSHETASDGEIDPTEQVIRIYSGLAPDKARQTFLHELMHGILQQLGRSDLSEDECLVQGLAIALHQAIPVQPRFVTSCV